MYRRVIDVVLCVFVFALAAWAQQDPYLGTWKTNLAKSKYDPGPAPRNPTTIKRESAPGGGVKTTVDGMDAQGNPTHSEYTASYDGKDYPVKGSTEWDTVAIRRIDANTRLLINKKGGNVVRLARHAVSPDGKTLTSISVGVDAQGHAFHDIAVYDKQ
jgi:hypothetical protein